MRSPFTHMYLRPGQLWKTFEVLRSKSENQTGYLVESHERTGEMVTGVISVADSQSSERTKHLWDQDKHSLTHTMVVRGRPDLRRMICWPRPLMKRHTWSLPSTMWVSSPGAG